MLAQTALLSFGSPPLQCIWTQSHSSELLIVFQEIPEMAADAYLNKSVLALWCQICGGASAFQVRGSLEQMLDRDVTYLVCCCSSSWCHPRLFFTYLSSPRSKFIRHKVYLLTFALFHSYSQNNLPPCHLFFFFLFSGRQERTKIIVWPLAQFFIPLQVLSFLGVHPFSLPSVCSFIPTSSHIYQKFGVFGDFSCCEFMWNKLHCKSRCDAMP